MAAEFVHLHVHSEFSMLDGAIRIPQLVENVGKMGMPAVALTDNGNMFGAVQLVRACQGTDVKPILGCEVNFTSGDRRDPQNRELHHLLLLATSQEGYHNLVRLVSASTRFVHSLVRAVVRAGLDVADYSDHASSVRLTLDGEANDGEANGPGDGNEREKSDDTSRASDGDAASVRLGVPPPAICQGLSLRGGAAALGRASRLRDPHGSPRVEDPDSRRPGRGRCA